MYSLDVPLPGRVHAQVDSLAPLISRLDAPRTDPGLLAKRLGDREPHELPDVERRLREVLAGQGPFEVAVDGTAVFTNPPNGDGVVWYLTVESPGLHAIHDAACEVVDPVAELEGEGYVPHVTLGRGDPDVVAEVDALAEVERVSWVVEALELYDARRDEVVRRLNLPL